MWSGLVYTCDQKANSVWALAVVLGVCLCAVCDGLDCALDWEGAAVGEALREGLRFQEVGEDAGVGGEAGESDTEVRVDCNDLLLVGGELFGVALGEC